MTPRGRRLLAGLSGGLALLAAGSLLWGRYPAPPGLTPRALWHDPLAWQLVWKLRLPRLLAALTTGGVLAVAGLTMQMVFRNPLVEPGFLGVSPGAAFGAALAILYLGASPWAVQLSATVFAFVGLGLTYGLARRLRYGGWILRMVLAGLAVSALLSAGLGLLKYLADPLTQLPEIVFWLLGGLWGVRWSNLLPVLLLSLPALALLWALRWRLNLLTLSENAAFALGAAPARERAGVLALAVVATAAVVSLAGMIGWVGLMAPHLARRLAGADARAALPTALALGGGFTLLCDDLARGLVGGEIPLGILTSLLGAAAFLLLLSSAPKT